MLLVMLLALGADGGPEGFDFDRIASLVELLRHDCSTLGVSEKSWTALRERSPCAVLHATHPAPATLEEAATILGRAWKVPSAAAEPLLEVELALHVAGVDSHHEPGFARWATAQFEAALAAAPGAPAILHAIAAGGRSPLRLAVLEGALTTMAAPAPVALTLAQADTPAVAALGVAVALAADASVLPEVLASDSLTELPLLLRLELLRLALGRELAVIPLTKLANSVYADLLKDGLPELALEVWQDLPDPVRTAVVLRRRASTSRMERLADPMLEAAVAALDIGQPKQAQTLAPLLKEPAWPRPVRARSRRSEADEEDCSADVLREVLLRARTPTRAARDAYPLARAPQTCYRGPHFARAFAKALQARMPRRAEVQLKDALRATQRPPWRSGQVTSSAVLTFARAAGARSASAKARAVEGLRQALADLTGPRASLPTVAERRLQSPPFNPWKERPLPPGLKPALEGEPHLELSSGLQLPKGYDPVRLERVGGEAWVVAASRGLDPSGEVSQGGYWLLRSKDGGASWLRPLYTGLRALEPYVVTSSSELPLVDEGQLRLEVRIRELDRKSITFPPIGLGFRREADGLFVETSLEALERDTDADGLTDLVEARLLTDPEAADTDQDGSPDGSDDFPTVARQAGAPSPGAQLTTEVLSALLRERGATAGAIRTGKALAGGPSPPLDFGAVTFLEGDPRDLAGVRSTRPVIVLSEQEADQLSRERGLLFPLRLDIVVNEAGTEGQVNWSEGWRWGSFDAYRQNGKWVLVSTGEWIT